MTACLCEVNPLINPAFRSSHNPSVARWRENHLLTFSNSLQP